MHIAFSIAGPDAPWIVRQVCTPADLGSHLASAQRVDGKPRARSYPELLHMLRLLHRSMMATGMMASIVPAGVRERMGEAANAVVDMYYLIFPETIRDKMRGHDFGALHELLGDDEALDKAAYGVANTVGKHKSSKKSGHPKKYVHHEIVRICCVHTFTRTILSRARV